MEYKEIIDQEKDLFKVIPMKIFRKTEGVVFDIVNMDFLPEVDGIDRVIHDKNALSPGSIKKVKRPWYMHPHQEDNLLVLFGTRHVDLYTPQHGKIENFEITSHSIKRNGKLLYDGGAVLSTSVKVFHRIRTGEKGSASVNFAVRDPEINMKTNFNIYSLDTETDQFEVLKKGIEDQKFN
ncbi:MAG: hypothetical protein R6V14_06390 [Halanaerobiales bacterium]